MVKIFKNFFYFISLVLFTIILIRLIQFDQILNFKAHLFYKKYYFICFIIFTFGFLANILNRNFFLNLSIFIISVLISLYSLESILYISEILKRGEDKRSIIKVYKDKINKYGNDYTISLPPSAFLDQNYKILPLSQKSNSWIVECNELGYYSINKTDRYGFNNNDNIWDEPYDIVFIGDSFVYGFCVNRENNMATVISNLTNKKILNLGMPANGFFLNYATFKEFASVGNSNKIFWFINDMDYMNFKAEFSNQVLNKYLNNPNFTQNLKQKTNETDIIINDLFKKRYNKLPFQKFLKLQRTFAFISFHLKFSKYDQKDFDKKKISQELKINIDKVFLNLKQNIDPNTKVFIIHLPLKNKFVDPNYNDKFKKLTKSYALKFDFKFVDLEKSYISNKNPVDLYSKYFGHHNEQGYKIMSEYLASIINNKLN